MRLSQYDEHKDDNHWLNTVRHRCRNSQRNSVNRDVKCFALPRANTQIPKVVTTRMSDCLQTGEPSRYIITLYTKVNSAFHPSGIVKLSTGLHGRG